MDAEQEIARRMRTRDAARLREEREDKLRDIEHIHAEIASLDYQLWKLEQAGIDGEED